MPTHGSLTKAGKVRSQTPKVYKTRERKSPDPLRSRRQQYLKRVVHVKPKWRRRR